VGRGARNISSNNNKRGKRVSQQQHSGRSPVRTRRKQTEKESEQGREEDFKKVRSSKSDRKETSFVGGSGINPSWAGKITVQRKKRENRED